MDKENGTRDHPYIFGGPAEDGDARACDAAVEAGRPIFCRVDGELRKVFPSRAWQTVKDA